jgi:hypothetical protein
MSGTRGPTCIDKGVLEVLLDIVDALARWILTGEELAYLRREAPNDGDVPLAQRCAHVVSQETDCLVECGITSTTEVFPSLSIDEIELGLYPLHQSTHFGKIGIGEFWDGRNA